MGLLDDALRAYAKFEDRTTDPATPAAGEGLVYFKDGAIHSIDDAGTVVTYGADTGGGGSGDLTLIDEEVLGASAATVDFSTIAATYRHLRIIGQARGTAAATVVQVSARFNADTGANYRAQLLRSNSASASASAAVSQTAVPVATISGASSPAGAGSFAVIDVPNYAGTTFHKETLGVSGHRRGTGSGDMYQDHYSGWWESTAAINQITLIPSTESFATGTVFSLYGLSTA